MHVHRLECLSYRNNSLLIPKLQTSSTQVKYLKLLKPLVVFSIVNYFKKSKLIKLCAKLFWTSSVTKVLPLCGLCPKISELKRHNYHFAKGHRTVFMQGLNCLFMCLAARLSTTPDYLVCSQFCLNAVVSCGNLSLSLSLVSSAVTLVHALQ